MSRIYSGWIVDVGNWCLARLHARHSQLQGYTRSSDGPLFYYFMPRSYKDMDLALSSPHALRHIWFHHGLFSGLHV